MPTKKPLKDFADLIAAGGIHPDPRPDDHPVPRVPDEEPVEQDEEGPPSEDEPEREVPIDGEPPKDPDEIISPDHPEKLYESRSRPVTEPGSAPRAGIIYESRIRVLDAWQYLGRVTADAPEWIDRNWIGWADHDGLRGLEAGPCLRVPLVTGDIAVCRAGDYIARQEVLMLADFPGDIRLEVWPQSQFEKLFIPTKADAA